MVGKLIALSSTLSFPLILRILNLKSSQFSRFVWLFPNVFKCNVSRFSGASFSCLARSLVTYDRWLPVSNKMCTGFDLEPLVATALAVCSKMLPLHTPVNVLISQSLFVSLAFFSSICFCSVFEFELLGQIDWWFPEQYRHFLAFAQTFARCPLRKTMWKTMLHHLYPQTCFWYHYSYKIHP
jgi:hypothetical protein